MHASPARQARTHHILHITQSYRATELQRHYRLQTAWKESKSPVSLFLSSNCVHTITLVVFISRGTSNNPPTRLPPCQAAHAGHCMHHASAPPITANNDWVQASDVIPMNDTIPCVPPIGDALQISRPWVSQAGVHRPLDRGGVHPAACCGRVAPD